MSEERPARKRAPAKKAASKKTAARKTTPRKKTPATPPPPPSPPPAPPSKPPWWRRLSGRGLRDAVLFSAGLAGVAYETIFVQADRPTLLLLFAAMMGLPAFLRTDEHRKS